VKRAVLIILDGFGTAKASPFNAIENANMPFFRELQATVPHATLLTHGSAVGLPEGVMGNSEVGHMTLGAGRIIYQDLTRLHHEIHTGAFFKNEVLLKAIKNSASRVHLCGLLSDAGVHSHIKHLEALLEMCEKEKVSDVFVHAFLDGRDTPPQSSPKYVQALQESGRNFKWGSLAGRYFAMDRDQRWDRVEKAYRAMTGQGHTQEIDPLLYIQHSHASGKSDEFVEPVLLNKEALVRDGDTLLFFNFRSDRARELTQSFVQKDFSAFKDINRPQLAAFVGMTQYEKNREGLQVAFEPQELTNIFGALLEERGLKQCRLAETEKYAHVTFFFNGGREQAFEGEDRVLIPSPKDVATYDLKPQMSASQVADVAVERISSQHYDFILMNFANADMVGHTGSYEAAKQAVEELDRCCERVVRAAQKAGYDCLITADHGNAEEMVDTEGRKHTQHTLNPVPVFWVPSSSLPKTRALREGTLADIVPTLCELMDLPIPKEVTGKSLKI
jgi:2,3-bisphosphoglycerate-independent phosphoglycerate mutase